MDFGFLDLGAPELIVILAIVLLLFGGKKLPELANSLGKSASELKKGMGGAADLRNEAKSQISQVKQTWNNAEHKQDGEA